MKKLSVKDIVVFRNKSDRAKQNFVNSLKIDKEKLQTDGGGDYWVICLSAISNSYKLSNSQPIVVKKEELEGKLEIAENTQTKNMYKRNINILSNYENFDFASLRPSASLNFLKKKKDDYILVIKGIPVQVNPHYVFAFDNNGVHEVGAIWFIAKLNGFKVDELGMFSEILYKYLSAHFSEQYIINPKHCVAIDVFNNMQVNYLQIENNEVSRILKSTISAIRALM